MTKYGPDHVCLIQYGHYGDILNILPIAWHLHQQGLKVHFLGQHPWTDLIAATSYVQKVELEKCDFHPMIWYASQKFERIILGRVRADFNECNRVGESYNRDQWYAAGYLHEWDNPQFKLVLDRAPEGPSPFRVPAIVCNVTRGESSPFHYGPKLLDKMLAAFPDQVMNVGEMKLPRFMDLLPIMREAKLVVSIDTGMLHLAGACPEVALLALTNPSPYGGSCIRRPVSARFTYREVRYDPGIVIKAIERILGLQAVAGWESAGEPKDPPPWPHCFVTGDIGTDDAQMRAAAELAWRFVLDGHLPCDHFHEVMTRIADYLGVSTDAFVHIDVPQFCKRPIQPQASLLTLPVEAVSTG